jgi:hypothetical protein
MWVNEGIRLKEDARSVAHESIFSNLSDSFGSEIFVSSSSDESDDESDYFLVDRWHGQENPGSLGDAMPLTPTRSDELKEEMEEYWIAQQGY